MARVALSRASKPIMAKARRGADEDMMGAAEGGKRVRKPGQASASGRVHDEEEHEGNLKFEVFAPSAHTLAGRWSVGRRARTRGPGVRGACAVHARLAACVRMDDAGVPARVRRATCW